MKLDLVPLMGRVMSGGVFWGICELGTTLGSLSADGWFCAPVLLVVCHEVSSTGAARSWVEPGLGLEMETSGRALSD